MFLAEYIAGEIDEAEKQLWHDVESEVIVARPLDCSAPVTLGKLQIFTGDIHEAIAHINDLYNTKVN